MKTKRLSSKTNIVNVAEVNRVKPISAFKYFQMTRLSRPASDRLIYKLIKQRNVGSIVEIGMGDGTRCCNMLAIAQKYNADSKIKYTGIDLFDARDEDKTPLKLIEMHRKLNAVDAKTQLVPGDLGSALPRIANAHVRTDMVIISAGFEDEDFEATQMFLPRMLHPSSVVLIQDYEDEEFYVHSRLEIEKMTAQSTSQTSRKNKAA